jgi:tight adherence protein B
MTGLVLALVAAYGAHLLYTSLVLGWTGVTPGPHVDRSGPADHRVRDWLVQAGLGDVRLQELGALAGVLFLVGGVLAYGLFGGILPAVAGGLFATTIPVAAARSRRERRRVAAREAWPRLLEELRIKTSTVGRSIPQALFEVAPRAPEDLRPAFAAAHREWLLSTDFERTLAVLRAGLADATADTVCETLLVAHQIGGNDIDRCLTALIEDRIADLQGRKDADAKQAGARFARRFVLIVPVAMAVIGLGIGDGRAAYATATGQLLVVAAIGVMAACWVWAGQIMRLPAEQRVLSDAAAPRRA